MKWLVWTETNDHEGGQWSRWLPLTKCPQLLRDIENCFLQAGEPDCLEPYEYDVVEASRAEVEFLCLHSGSGYTDYNAIVDSPPPKLSPNQKKSLVELFKNGDSEEDEFYKLAFLTK